MKENLLSIYNEKKILVTGSSGFKGSWLCFWLHQLGAEVTGYSLDPPTRPSLFQTLAVDKKIKQYTQDIRDVNTLEKCLKATQPDIIFHMAAQPLVRESYSNPRETFDVNMMGTLNLLEIVRTLNLNTTIVCITSDKSYENKEWLFGYREDDPMGGYDPYSASKGASELIINSYRNSFFNPLNYGKTHRVKLASVRAGNVIGGGDWAKDRIVPDCIRSLRKKETIIIRNPSATRPWQHVLEPLGGYLMLGARLYQTSKSEQIDKFASSFNFGPLINSNKEVGVLVQTVIDEWGEGSWIHEKEDILHEASKLNLTIDKAYHLLDWFPVWNFETTVQQTVSWYKAFYNQTQSIEDFTAQQISLYEEAWSVIPAYT